MTWMGDHSPRHVHIFKDGCFVAKWNLCADVAMKGRVDSKLRKIIKDLKKEGRL